MPLRPLPAIAVFAFSSLPYLAGTPATAQSVDVIVDSTEVELTPGEKGIYKGSIIIANTRLADVVVTAAVVGDPGCAVTPKPTSVGSGRRTKVDLELGAGCEVEGGTTLNLAFGEGVTPRSVDIDAVPLKDEKVRWDFLASGAMGALVLTALVLAAVSEKILELRREESRPENIASRIVQRRNEQADLIEAREARGVALTAPGDEPGLADDVPPGLGRRSPLPGLGPDWSFKDSWVANVTLGSTALVALVAASDVLEAAFGEKPENALSVIVVASAMASATVGLAPLVLKAVGDETDTVTVGGLLVGGAVTLLGAFFQLLVVTLQMLDLTSNWIIRAAIVVASLGAVVTVMSYGSRALRGFISEGSKPPKEEVSPQVEAAWVVAAALRPNEVERRLTPYDLDRILDEDTEYAKHKLRELQAEAEAAMSSAPEESAAAVSAAADKVIAAVQAALDRLDASPLRRRLVRPASRRSAVL